MSKITLVAEERAAEIGNFIVGKSLPFHQKRMVGPFVFIDNIGPAKLKDYQKQDAAPHPHIGVSTLTYLFDGVMLHRDSLGSEVEIRPGAVGCITAGNGIVHSERTPNYLRTSEKELRGLQVWLALPKHLEETDPSYTYIDAGEIPEWGHNGLRVKLIAGEAFGRTSPVPVHSPLYLLEIKNGAPINLNIGNELYGESALYILKGSVTSDTIMYDAGKILVAKESTLCSFEMAENSTIYIFGGNPLPEERYRYWNFVSSSMDRLEKAKEDWINQRFPKVPGETEFISIPQTK